VVETHPESLIDLRVHAPFPALLAFAESFDYEKMDSMEHGHIPAVIILVKALEAWKSTVRDFLSSTLACSFAYQE
jgi:amyloid beta precursor protein binding protein 1